MKFLFLWKKTSREMASLLMLLKWSGVVCGSYIFWSYCGFVVLRFWEKRLFYQTIFHSYRLLNSGVGYCYIYPCVILLFPSLKSLRNWSGFIYCRFFSILYILDYFIFLGKNKLRNCFMKLKYYYGVSFYELNLDSLEQ